MGPAAGQAAACGRQRSVASNRQGNAVTTATEQQQPTYTWPPQVANGSGTLSPQQLAVLAFAPIPHYPTPFEPNLGPGPGVEAGQVGGEVDMSPVAYYYARQAAANAAAREAREAATTEEVSGMEDGSSSGPSRSDGSGGGGGLHFNDDEDVLLLETGGTRALGWIDQLLIA